MDELDVRQESKMQTIYKALLWSALTVILTGVASWVFAWLLSRYSILPTQPVLNWLQYGGIGILLWATLAKQGWNIQTWGGKTTAEKADQWVFRILYVVGSFCLFLSVMWPALRTKNAEQGGTGQPATRSESKSEGNLKPQPEAEGRSR